MSGPSAMQTRDRVRRADLAALVVSGIAAAIAPLQVFLLAFALLGPLHYLTELAWLRRKQFYLRDGGVSSRAYVLLEFPLNWQTLRFLAGTKGELAKWLTRRRAGLDAEAA